MIDRLLVAVRCVGLVESVTVIETVLAPAAVGVPVIAPVDGSMLSPAGRPVADHVYGVVPPLALTVALYAAPATPPGSDDVVMFSGAMTVSVRFAVAVRWDGLLESVTVIATVLAPAAVGVPLICPVEALRVNPAGSPVADHVYGDTPPVAARVAPGYAVFTTPEGSDDVVMVNCPAIVIDRLLLAVRWAGLLESVTVIVTVLVVAAVGVPAICPVDALRVNPAGRPVADQVYGGAPPVAARVTPA